MTPSMRGGGESMVVVAGDGERGVEVHLTLEVRNRVAI